MKAQLLLLIVGATLLVPSIGFSYSEIDYDTLKVDPKKFKNDRVTYTATYKGFLSKIPRFADRSGFNQKKHVMFGVGSHHVPVMAKNDDEMKAFLAKVKEGSIVKVSGKIREFRIDPKRAVVSGFYLDLEGIELVKSREERVEDLKDRGGNERPRKFRKALRK